MVLVFPDAADDIRGESVLCLEGDKLVGVDVQHVDSFARTYPYQSTAVDEHLCDDIAGEMFVARLGAHEEVGLVAGKVQQHDAVGCTSHQHVTIAAE